MRDALVIISAEETPYFSTIPGTRELGAWVMVSIDSESADPRTVRATIAACGRTASCMVNLKPGRGDYRLYAPALWPEIGAPVEAILTIETGTGRAETTVVIGRHRPWTIHLLSDLCLDYTWAYATELACEADDVATTEAEVRAMAASSALPPDIQNRWNFAVGRELGLYLAYHDRESGQELIDRIRSGHVSVNPIPNMNLSAAQSLEELIRQLYPARRWERAFGIPIRYANHQETPTMAWTLASVLAGAGITHLVKGVLPFGTPWCARLAEPPVFQWEGPDGAVVMVRRFNQHYNEGQFVLRDLPTIDQAVERKLLPEYEALGPSYPLSSIGLVGCYGDLSPSSPSLASAKVAGIARYNAREWEYPRLVNASHQTWWAAVEAELTERNIRLPVVRGDYGTGWEVWLLSLARLYAGWRRLQERSCLADTLCAVAGWLEPAERPALAVEVERGWNCLTNLADHAWNGSDEANRKLNRSLRERWVAEASATFDAAIERSFAIVAAASGGESPGWLVFNGLGWRRTTIAVLPDAPVGGSLLDEETGEDVPYQRSADGRSWLIVARDLPPVGYRRYRSVPSAGGRTGTPRGSEATVDAAAGLLENEYYRLTVDPRTGAIRSLVAKRLGRELVDTSRAEHVAQWLYHRGGRDVGPERAAFRAGETGPAVAELVAESCGGPVSVNATLRLADGVDRLEIDCRVRRPPTSEREKLHFLFPLDVCDRVVRVDLPGAVMRVGERDVGGEQLPGAGQAYQAVRHVADVSNDGFGVTVAQVDSGFFQFGHRTEDEDPRQPDRAGCALLAFVLDNTVNYAEGTRDQGGETEFRFRFSLRAHGPFDAGEAVRFGAEASNEPLAAATGVAARGRPAGPALRAFVGVDGEGIVCTTVKAAEEHPEDGIAVRLWNVDGKPAEGSIRLAAPWRVATATETDLLERPVRPLVLRDGTVNVTVPGRGYQTVVITCDRGGA